jgi:glycine cleavage system regulatory protein
MEGIELPISELENVTKTQKKTFKIGLNWKKFKKIRKMFQQLSKKDDSTITTTTTTYKIETTCVEVIECEASN